MSNQIKIKRPTGEFLLEMTKTLRDAKDGSGKKEFPFLAESDQTLDRIVEFVQTDKDKADEAWDEVKEIVLASLRTKFQQVWESQKTIGEGKAATRVARTPAEREANFIEVLEKPNFSQRQITVAYLTNKMGRLTKELATIKDKDRAKLMRAEIMALMNQVQEMVLAGVNAATDATDATDESESNEN